MSLKTKVKVGNITNLSDARYCAGMGVDMLGFAIGETDGQGVGATKFKEITDWISGPEFILELPEGAIDGISEKYNVSLIELHASEISKPNLLKSGQQFIIRIDLSNWKQYQKDLLQNIDAIKYVIVANSHSLNDHEAKSIVAEMAVDFSVLLGFEIKVQLLDEYLRWPIAGLALNGSAETSPGIKDYDHLSSILEKLEVE
jgi:phosphoribosylanthranilate isomerase